MTTRRTRRERFERRIRQEDRLEKSLSDMQDAFDDLAYVNMNDYDAITANLETIEKHLVMAQRNVKRLTEDNDR